MPQFVIDPNTKLEVCTAVKEVIIPSVLFHIVFTVQCYVALQDGSVVFFCGLNNHILSCSGVRFPKVFLNIYHSRMIERLSFRTLSLHGYHGGFPTMLLGNAVLYQTSFCTGLLLPCKLHAHVPTCLLPPCPSAPPRVGLVPSGGRWCAAPLRRPTARASRSPSRHVGATSGPALAGRQATGAR